MKAWRTIAVAALAFIAVALITTTALAYNAAGQGTNGSYGGYGAAQRSGSGMMHGYMTGPMGCVYSQYSNYTSFNGSQQQNSNPRDYGSCTGGCGMRNGWP
jgi:hypothetical protein